MSEWISVKDRLPDIGRDVLIVESYYGDVGLGYIRSDNKKWAVYTPDGIEAGDVTHWMSVPDPPEESLV